MCLGQQRSSASRRRLRADQRGRVAMSCRRERVAAVQAEEEGKARAEAEARAAG